VIAMFPWFGYGLSEKCVLLASMGQWDQALDTAQRALDADAENLDALKVIAVHAFLLEAHPGDAARKLQDFDNAVTRREPSGAKILLEASQLFSRVCNRQPRSLEICRAMLERALKIKPDDGAVLVEIANIQVLQRQYSSALKAYVDASKRNKNDMSALEGNVKCHILLGELEDAEAQMELLEMMQMSPEEASPEFYLLKSMLMLKQIKSRSSDVEAAMKNHLAMLENAYFTFFKRFEETVKGFLEPLKELVVMDTGFMMQMAMGFASHMDIQMPVFLPPSSNANSSGANKSFSSGSLAAITSEASSGKAGEPDELSHAVETAIGLLKRILQKAPGCVPAYLELAKILAGLSKHDEACKVLRQCLGMLPNCAAALLLTARIECSRYNTAAANRALEQALSGNFAIRRVLLFRYTQAVVRAQQGRTDEALAEIVALSQLPELAISMSGGVSALGAIDRSDASELEDSFLDLLEITDDDRVALIIAHATLLSKAGKNNESAKLLSDARVNFTGSSMEVHLLIASAQLSIDRGDFEGAIRHLDKIKPESSSFYRAQLMKGEILLVHNHDKEAFTKCYQSLVESDPSSKNYTLLGEAYIRILNPERAVEAFEKARRLDSSNTKLRVRIGKALIATHEYHRAVSFYENILNDSGEEMSPEIILLSHDLSKLYVKLGRIESACRVLQAVLHPTYRDISEMQLDVKTLELLAFATTQQSVGNAASVGDADDRDSEDIIGYLSRARQIQIDVVSQCRSNSTSSSEAVDRERAILSSIDEKIAKLYIDLKDFSKAETFVTEAIQHNPQNTKAMHLMAQVYLSRNEVELCANQLRKVLLADPSDESAAVLLSNVAFKDSDAAEDAIRPLRDLIVINPTSYRALAKMITMLRRVGKLDEVPALFSRAESANKRSASHPGMHYCKGIYYRYTNDVIKAITEFNRSRTDSQWGADSLIHMIELYLNPDQDGVWEERDSSSVIGEEVAENISVAERLLSELRPICK
jgi:tetratricopeptide repeat protein 21B